MMILQGRSQPRIASFQVINSRMRSLLFGVALTLSQANIFFAPCNKLLTTRAFTFI